MSVSHTSAMPFCCSIHWRVFTLQHMGKQHVQITNKRNRYSHGNDCTFRNCRGRDAALRACELAETYRFLRCRNSSTTKSSTRSLSPLLSSKLEHVHAKSSHGCLCCTCVHYARLFVSRTRQLSFAHADQAAANLKQEVTYAIDLQLRFVLEGSFCELYVSRQVVDVHTQLIVFFSRERDSVLVLSRRAIFGGLRVFANDFV